MRSTEPSPTSSVAAFDARTSAYCTLMTEADTMRAHWTTIANAASGAIADIDPDKFASPADLLADLQATVDAAHVFADQVFPLPARYRAPRVVGGAA